MRATGEETDLIAAILRSPDEDQPRLQYAQWLRDHDSDLSELILWQLKLENQDSWPKDPKIDKIKTTLLKRWKLPPDTVLGFRLGMVDSISVSAEILRRRKTPFLRGFALKSLTLVGDGNKEPIDERILDFFPATLDLTLRFESMKVTLAAAKSMASSKCFKKLMEITLYDCSIDKTSIGALFESSDLGLSKLDFRCVPLDQTHCRELSNIPCFQKLDGLELVDCGIDLSCLKAFLANASPRLKTLGLSFNPVSVEGAHAIAAAPTLSSLERLNLVDSEIYEAGLRALCESSYLSPNLTLRLDGGGLGLAPAYLGDHADHVYAWWEGNPPEWLTRRFKNVEVGDSPPE